MKDETRKKISESKKGSIPWNKGKKGLQVAWNKGKPRTWYSSGDFKKGHKSLNKGIKMSEEQKLRLNMKGLEKGRGWMRGKHHTKETREKISKILRGSIPWNKNKKQLQTTGDKNPNWKGGVTSIHNQIRHSLEYEEWRKKVFERDLYTCQCCGQIGGKLNADHIKPFSLYPELRLELSNGRTLCENCHNEIGWCLFKESNPRKNLKNNYGNTI